MVHKIDILDELTIKGKITFHKKIRNQEEKQMRERERGMNEGGDVREKVGLK